MFEKQGKFYADWRDRTGRRKRKSFDTAKAALRFEEEQKEIARPRLRLVGRTSRDYSTRQPINRSPAQPVRSQSSSSPKSDTSARSNSARRTSSTSMRHSSRPAGRRRLNTCEVPR